MLNPKLRFQLIPKEPGTALLEIRGWKGSYDGLQLGIENLNTKNHLDENGRWGSAAWISLPDSPVVEPDGAIYYKLGANYIDPIAEAGSSERFGATIRQVDGLGNQTAISQQGSLVYNVRELMSSGGRGNFATGAKIGSFQQEQMPKPAPAPIPEPMPEPVPMPEPEPAAELPPEPPVFNEPPPMPAPEPMMSSYQPPAKSGSLLWLWILLGVLLLAAVGGGAAWYFLTQHKHDDVPASEPFAAAPAQPDAAPAPAKNPCDLDNAGSDELKFIQACLAEKPSTSTILATISQAKSAGKCELARRLYANQANGGNAEIAVAYANEFAAGGACFDADKDSAEYWYNQALSIDPDNAAAKQGLQGLK